MKRPPIGFPKDFEDIDLLKFKDYTVFNRISDNDTLKPEFLKTSVRIFEKMNPFNKFLNRALD